LLQLGTRFNPDVHQFVIDLAADHGPRRVRKPDADKPMRFWDATAISLKVDELHTALRDGAAPAQLGLTENARTSESLELLEYLQHKWSTLSSREQRRAPRESVKRLVDVAHGLNAIIGQLKSADAPPSVSPYGTGLNAREVDDVQVYGFITDRTRERVSQIHIPATSTSSPDIERWVMQDESECGYGALVESRDKDWLRVGALVSVKSHDAAAWRLGIIRRLSRLNDDTSSVGIETLTEAPTLAMLYDTTTTSSYTVNGVDNSNNSQPHASLWLTGSAGGTDSVIIDPIHFMPGKIFQIHGVPQHAFIALGKPVERSEGWIRVNVDQAND
jgi:hypothetical protein